MFFSFFFFLCLLCIPYTSLSNTTWVFNQSQFDEVVKEINGGKEKDIFLSPGTYVLNEKIVAKNNLSITGNNSSITWHNDTYTKQDAIYETNTHYVCKIKSKINPFSLFVDDNDNLVNVSESVDSVSLVNTTSQEITGEISGKAGAIINIPIADNLTKFKNRSFSNSYGYFECGWAKVNFILLSSDREKFKCKTLENTNVPNFNFDLTNYKKEIRYVFFNLERKKNCVFYNNDYIFIPKFLKRLFCVNCVIYNESDYSIKSISNIILNGITFKNFNGISINLKSSEECIVKNCKFRNTLGCALYLNKDNGNGVEVMPAIISHCEFYSCSLVSSNVVSLISKYCKTKCIVFDNCVISRYPNNLLSYKNCGGSLLVSADAVISNNTIFNSPRSHMFLDKGFIEINGNTLYNTEDFNSFQFKNLSNDFGLIYCNHIFRDTQQALDNTLNNILIVNNLIYGAHAYRGDARGIMIDDGRGDVNCRNNVIFDTDRYNIESRDAKSFISSSSVRNILESNILDTNYMLASGKDVPKKYLAISKGNILLGEYQSVKTRVIIKEEDMVLPLQSKIYCKDGKAVISKADYRKLRKLKNWKYVKKFFLIR